MVETVRMLPLGAPECTLLYTYIYKKQTNKSEKTRVLVNNNGSLPKGNSGSHSGGSHAYVTTEISNAGKNV